MDSIYVFGFLRERRIDAPIARCGSLRSAMAERTLHEAHRECLIGIRHEQFEPTREICGRVALVFDDTLIEKEAMRSVARPWCSCGRMGWSFWKQELFEQGDRTERGNVCEENCNDAARHDIRCDSPGILWQHNPRYGPGHCKHR